MTGFKCELNIYILLVYIFSLLRSAAILVYNFVHLLHNLAVKHNRGEDEVAAERKRKQKTPKCPQIDKTFTLDNESPLATPPNS